MTDNVALRAAMNDMFGDLQKERRYSGSRASLPPVQPGLAAPDAAIAPGQKCEFATLETVPMVTPEFAVGGPNMTEDDLKALAAKQLQFNGLTLKVGWWDTEQGGQQVDFASHAGGPSPGASSRTGSQENVQPNYLNAPKQVQ